jgi:RHS repeat-associated protein
MKNLLVGLVAYCFGSLAFADDCVNPYICETKEIVYEAGEAIVLKNKAAELGSIVNIYQFVRSNSKYIPYHGARSNSLNTFLSMEGNDVDLASLLIALLRSQGVSARYSVGNVQISESKIANWMGVDNTSLAESILYDHGIPILDNSPEGTISFEHTWVEVLVNFSGYRGANSEIVSCFQEGKQCHWVALDPSFKQYAYKSENRKLLEGILFDYNEYYNAESIPNLVGKNPLEIFEEQALVYLRNNHPGATLEDIVVRNVVSEDAGLLPSSLPYEVVSSPLHFLSVEEHDIAELNSSRDWSNYITVRVHDVDLVRCVVNNIPSLRVNIVDLSTERLMIALKQQGGVGQDSLALSLGGELVGFFDGSCSYRYGSWPRRRTRTLSTYNSLANSTTFSITVTADASPVAESLGDYATALYENLAVSGRHVIVFGGNSSNWSQVKRAYDQLILAESQYPLISAEDGSVYVDEDGDENVSEGDSSFIDNTEAQDALTGGLLHLVQSLYKARAKNGVNRLASLKNTVAPINTFLGVISTTYDIERIDGTPFSVQPGGLLIDLKGNSFLGVWESDEESAYSSEVFKLIGHHMSALEHEVWQELTGFDAISTMRGIQLAVAEGASVLDIHNTTSENLLSVNKIGAASTYASSLESMGFKKDIGEVDGWEEWDNWVSYSEIPITAIDLSRGNYDDEALIVIKGDAVGVDEDTPYLDMVHVEFTTENMFGAQQPISAIVVGTVIEGMSEMSRNIKEPYVPDVCPNCIAGSRYHANGYIKINSAYRNQDTTKKVSSFNMNGTWNGSYYANYGLVKQVENGVRFQVNRAQRETTGTQIAYFPYYNSTSSYGEDYTVIEVIPEDYAKFKCPLTGGYSEGPATEVIIKANECLNGWSDFSFFNYTSLGEANYYYLPVGKSDSTWSDHYSPVILDYMATKVMMADELYWHNFIMPSKPIRPVTVGQPIVYNVWIEEKFKKNTAEEVVDESATYAISLDWCDYTLYGGGYVPLGQDLNTPAELTDGVGFGFSKGAEDVTINDAYFDNAYFTDQLLPALSNNDLVMTASTWDPVATATGNMYHDETDLIIPGKGLPYTFTRTYNSNPTTTSGEGSFNPDHFPLSQGWTHSYNMKLVANDFGQYPNHSAERSPKQRFAKTSSITYVNERGGELNYLLDSALATSQPTPPEAFFDDLNLNDATGLHTLTFRNGVQYEFESKVDGAVVSMRTPGSVAYLKRIIDPYNNQLIFNYTNGQLTSITDNLSITNRTGLTLSYYTTGDNIGRLQYVTDWTNRSWEYQYRNGQLSGVKNPLNDQMAYTYSYNEGKPYLKDIVHPQNRNGVKKSMSFSYYQNGRAYNYIDQSGNEESLAYDLYRRKTRITNPLGDMTDHSYDNKGALVKLVEPDQGIMLFENNADGLRYTKYNQLGQRTRYSYESNHGLSGEASDTFGKVTREEDPMGNTIDYSYGAYDQISSVTDKNSNTFSNVYYSVSDAVSGAVTGKLWKKVANLGVTPTAVMIEEHKYNQDGTVKQTTRYLDKNNSAIKQTLNYTYVFNSDGTYKVTSVISGYNADNITTENNYDSLWRLSTSKVWRKTSATDTTLLALETQYYYDDLSRLIKTVDPIGNIAEVIYDENGKVYQKLVRYKLTGSNDTAKHAQCTVDVGYTNYHTCILVTNSYDAGDRLIGTTNIMGANTAYKYDGIGNLTQVTNHLGKSLHYQYDAMSRRTKVTNENGYSTNSKYDLAGNVTSVTDANNNTVSYTYDANGRLLTTTTPEGRITKIDLYDGNGNIEKMSDANSSANVRSTLVNKFDEFNRLVSTQNLESEETKFAYDLLGNRTQVIDARNQATQFVHDGLGRLTSVIDPIIESGTDKVISITYDELGNRLTYTDRLGEVTRYTYDRLNRLTHEEYVSDDISATKVYDQYGVLVSTSYDGITYTYEYDAAHRLVSKTDTRNNLSMTWAYNIVGSLIKKTNYQGDVYKYTYDSTNRLVSMSVGEPVMLQASYQYDGAGRLLSRSLSNGATSIYRYTDDGLLLSLKQVAVNGFVVDMRQYSYDNVGNIKQLTIKNPSNRNLIWAGSDEVIRPSYDNAYRLESANSSITGKSISYSYDEVGNRITKTYMDRTQYYIYESANQLKEIRLDSITGTLVYQYKYDANGSMVAKYDGAGVKLLGITYDQRRLASAMVPVDVSDSASFKYDANFYRVEKQTSQLTDKYLLEGEHLEATYNKNDELKAKFLRGAVIDEVITSFEKNENGLLSSHTYHHDQVNSVIATTDHNGSPEYAVYAGPFGEQHTAQNFRSKPLQYTGRPLDGETGLYYYRARYYDPEIGRFISEDPIGFAGGINFYAYVGNNPLVYNDPTGNGKASLYDDGVKLIINVKDTWVQSQIDAATMKASQLDSLAKQGLLIKNTDIRPTKGAGSIFKEAGNDLPSGFDADHIHEWQLGGSYFDPDNLQGLDKSVNRSFGSQIYHQMKNSDTGTYVTGVSLFFGSMASQASDFVYNTTSADALGYGLEFALGDAFDLLIASEEDGTGDLCCGPGATFQSWAGYNANSSNAMSAGNFLYPSQIVSDIANNVYQK